MPSTDPGERIYAVGDLHGRQDLLELLLKQIGEHAQALPPAQSLYIVFLGDIVDRGPRSAQTLGMLYDLQSKTDQVVVLLGNHEDIMLQALDGDMDALRGWLSVGGADTLRSFGMEPLRKGDDPREYLRQMRAAIPREWVKWLRRLPLSVQSGDYYFVHAGVRPGVSLQHQARNDMLWIREGFLDDDGDMGAVIVHGHTVVREVEILANRIAVDTGAYRSGVLSAIYLEGDRQEIISARLPAGVTT